MAEGLRYTLSKEERICSKLQIEKLFGGGQSHSLAAFPLRMVYLFEEADDERPPVSILVSVPKKYFKHAVDRNRVKRQVREAYRLNKHSIIDKVQTRSSHRLMIAFIWTDSKLHDSSEVTKKVIGLLKRLEDKITPKQSSNE